MGKVKKSEKSWQSFDAETYADYCRQTVHLSLKSVNSNAQGGGIRLAADPQRRLPYVAVTTQLAAGQTVALDYMKNAGKTATLAKQVGQYLNDDPAVPADEAAMIAAALAQSTSAAHFDIDQVDARMRQLLLPLPDGSDYLAVTPLASGGTARRIKHYVEQHNAALKADPELRKTRRKLVTASLGFGGSNPQNVGSLVRDLQTLLYVAVPAANPRLRAVLALHYRGPQLRLALPLLRAFGQWRRQTMRRLGGAMASDAAARDQEKTFIVDLVKQALRGVEQDAALLRSQQHLLPKSATDEPIWFADSVPADLQALIDPSRRVGDWQRSLAARLTTDLLSHRDGDESTLGCDDGDRRYFQNLIEEVLWTY